MHIYQLWIGGTGGAQGVSKRFDISRIRKPVASLQKEFKKVNTHLEQDKAPAKQWARK